jgi:hypothetical protein
MPKTKTTQADRAAEVVPERVPAAPWRIKRLEVLSGHRLRLEFMDRTKGEVDLSKFLASPRIAGTAFEALRDEREFGKVFLEFGAPEWPNGANLAPDALWDDVKVHTPWVIPPP